MVTVSSKRSRDGAASEELHSAVPAAACRTNGAPCQHDVDEADALVHVGVLHLWNAMNVSLQEAVSIRTSK